MPELSVSYRVRILPLLHELSLELTVEGHTAGTPLSLQLPTWVPGAYALMKYGRDLFSLEATDASTGAGLRVERDGWQRFRVLHASSKVTVRYTLHSYDPAWGELTGLVDHQYAVLIGPRYLVPAEHQGAVKVEYQLPEGWALHHPAGGRRLSGNTFQYDRFALLLDTPVVAGAFTVKTRTVRGVPFHHLFLDSALGFEREVEGFLDSLVAIAEQAFSVFGSFPFESYTYVFSFAPTAHWGLEHANGTMIGLSPDALIDPDARQRAIRVCAHELFHAWNVCRLMPAPFLQKDFQHGSFTEGLWISEGFTRYYEFLFLVRAKVLTVEQFVSNVVNYYRHLADMPAYQRVSPADASYATFLNHNKYPGSINNTIDYYDAGMLVAFDLDAALRLQKQPSSLDAAFADFFRAYTARPSETAGFTTADALHFFGDRVQDFASQLDAEVRRPASLSTVDQLKRLGFELRTEPVRYLGLVLAKESGPGIQNVLDTGPAAKSGIAPEDELQRVNGYPYSIKSLKWAIAHQPKVTLSVLRGHRYLEFEIPVDTRERITQVSWAGNDAQLRVLQQWLGRPEFKPAIGQSLALNSFENFHGIQAVI